MHSFLSIRSLGLAFTGLAASLCLFVLSPLPVAAVGCSITTDTVIDAAYVSGNGCTSIDIQADVSTTWIGLVDLGGGTVTVKDGFTMTMGSSSEMRLGTSDDFVIEANATATHLLGDTNGIKVTARNITITGALTASERGCARGLPFGNDGFGVDILTGQCGFQTGGYGRGAGAGGGGGGGGSYAGSGGGGLSAAPGGTVVYGNAVIPNSLGSGGGTGYYSAALGGAGGGIVHATATGILTVNGTVSSRGGVGGYEGIYNGGGGGAGGSIMIHAGTLAGSGLISVDGGAAGSGGGGGSGGRAAIYYGSMSGFSPSNISVVGGIGVVSGATGTSFMLDRYTDDGAGTVTISTAFDFPSGGDYARDAFSISSGARLGCGAATNLTVSSTAWLILDNVSWTCSSAITTVTLGSNLGISTTNTSMIFSNATSVNITTPTWTNVTTTLELRKSGARSVWDISSNLTLRNLSFYIKDAGYVDISGGFLFLPRSISLTMVSSTIAASASSTSLTALNIDGLSSIDASGRGCPRSEGALNGSGPDTTTGICAVSISGAGIGGGGSGAGGGGGAHAGTGGAGAGVSGNTSTYGSSTDPVFFGSSGGGGYYIDSAPGGGAGGVIHLTIAGSLTVNGSIKANGTNGIYGGSYTGGGGGAGGSINITSNSLTGSGSITANGGAGSDGGGGGGGGGGGRIALRYAGLSFSGTSSTNAGAEGTGGMGVAGTSGSIYVFQTNQAPTAPTSLGLTSLVNGSTTGTNTPIFNFTLSDPDVLDTNQYQIQIDNTSDFSSPVVDYTSPLGAQGSRSFQVGQAVGLGSYAVGSSGQTLTDGSYYWRVKNIDAASSASAYTTANSGAIAFQVDTVTRLVAFQESSGSGLESVTATSVKVVLSATHFETVNVSYSVTGGTATGSGTDYTLAAGTATIAIGNTSTTIPFTIVNDLVREPNETIVITLSSPSHASLGTITQYTYTITDNDTAGVTLSKSSLSVSEGGSADSYTLVLTSQPTSTVTIAFTPSTRLTVSPVSVSFTGDNWSTPQTVTVSVTDDGVFQGTQTGSLAQVLTSTAHGYDALTLSALSVAITDNDSPPGGSIAPGGSLSQGLLVPIGSLASPTEPPLPSVPVLSPPPVVVILPEPAPGSPSEIVTILNPRDVISLVEATNGSRDISTEARYQSLLRQDARDFRVPMNDEQSLILANFVTYGISERTRLLGAGERRALVRDAIQTMGTANISTVDLERMTRGLIPLTRNITEERRQLPRVRSTFRSVYGHDPNFQNAEENLAWNTLMYRIRFPRDLTAEQEGVREFRRLFNRAPQDPFQWATVRVLGYVER